MPGNSWAAGCKAIEESVKKEHFLPSRYMIKQRGGRWCETMPDFAAGLPALRQLCSRFRPGADSLLFLSQWFGSVFGGCDYCGNGVYIGPPVKGVRLK